MANHQTTLYSRLARVMALLVGSVAVAATAAYAWQVHRTSQAADDDAVAAMAQLGAVEIAEAARAMTTDPFHPDEGDRLTRQFERWSWAAIRRPDVLATGLLDGQGRLIHSVPPDVPVEDVLAGSPRGCGECWSCKINLFGRNTIVVARALELAGSTGAGPPGKLVLIAEHRPISDGLAKSLIGFAVPVAVVGVAALALGLAWVRRNVQAPLDRLLRRSREDIETWLARLPTDLTDEFGRIARQAEQAAAELSDASTELAKVRHRADTRVVQETRKIKQLLANTQKQVWLDPLTKLGNRRLLQDRLEAVVEAQAASGDDLTMVMFDIDHFKELNDTKGHAAGDDLLRFFGELLRSSIREQDLGIRYGGDEFQILLPGVGPQQAATMANRIVRLFAQHASTLKTKPQPTLSAGVASLRSCATRTGKDLTAQADAALYEAKAEGKNRVCVQANQPMAASSI